MHCRRDIYILSLYYFESWRLDLAILNCNIARLTLETVVIIYRSYEDNIILYSWFDFYSWNIARRQINDDINNRSEDTDLYLDKKISEGVYTHLTRQSNVGQESLTCRSEYPNESTCRHQTRIFIYISSHVIAAECIRGLTHISLMKRDVIDTRDIIGTAMFFFIVFKWIRESTDDTRWTWIIQDVLHTHTHTYTHSVLGVSMYIHRTDNILIMLYTVNFACTIK